MGKPDNPFEELLESLAEQMNKDGDDDSNSGGDPPGPNHKKLTPAEMLKHLQVGYSLLTRKRIPLKPGDIVRGIRELTESHIRNWDHPHIILEVLDRPIKLDLNHEAISTNITSKHYDCVVLSCVPTRGNGWMVQHYADSRDFELYPDADKLKTDTHS